MADGDETPRPPSSATILLGLFEACPDAIIVTDLVGGAVVAANSAASALFGIPLEQLLGTDRNALVDIDDPRLVEARVEREQTGRYRGGFRVVRGDGSAVEVTITTVSFLGPDASPLVGSILRDAGEPAPRTAGEDVFLSAFDMIMELGPGGVITNINDAAGTRLGYAREELIGRVSTDFVAAESHSMVLERLARRLRGEEPTRATVHFDVIAKDGERFPVAATAVTVLDGGRPVGSRVVLRDVVERRRLEDVERSYRELFASAFEILVSITPDGTIEDINDAGARLLQIPLPQLVGSNVAEFLDPAEHASLLAELERRRGGEPEAEMTESRSATLELELVSRTGSRIPIEVTVTAVADGARLVRYVAVATDLRPARAREEERRRLDSEINRAEKLRSLGILAGGIAHDFNNILMSILGHVSLAQREGATSAEVAESLEVIERGGRRAAELANQMLAYSGQGRYLIEPVSVAELVTGGADRLRDTIDGSIELELAIPSVPTNVEGDASQLLQVLFAMVNNAAEAIGSGPGVVSIALGRVAVGGEGRPSPRLADGRHLGDGDYITLEVRDDGSGIDAETAERIFEPFYTTRSAGRGLGLAAVLGIVRGHGGGLTFESTPGLGSRFCVLLPAAVSSLAPDAPAPTTERREGRGVLVVDDEPAVRAVVLRMLERSGYSVFEADDGQAGIDALEEHATAVDLVLLDLNMPGLSPEATVEGIHRLAPDVPLLLMSGYTEHAAEELGVIHPIDFIQKPFTVEELLAKVASVIA